MKIKSIVIILTCLSTASFAQSKSWLLNSKLALQQIRQTVRSSMMVYLDNPPTLNQSLNKNYTKAICMASTQPNRRGYLYSLAFYTAGFNDPHFHSTTPLFSNLISPIAITLKNPGILVSYQHQQYQVSYRNPTQTNLPPIGATLISCDNKPIEALVQSDILPFHVQARAHSQATKFSAAIRIFLDGNPFRRYPKQCTFQVNHHSQQYKINWHTLSQQQAQSIPVIKNLLANPYHFSIMKLKPDGLWLSIPSLETSAQTNNFFKHLKQLKNLRDHRPIVIDLRGNDGGNTTYANQLMKQLFGKAYFNKISTNSHSVKQIRLSKQNLARLKKNKTVGTEILKKMKQALDKKETFFTLAKPHQPQQNPTHIQSQYHHGLFVILDHHCFSSCLIFASQLARYPNTIFIGQPTASVSHYGEINTINLTGGATLQYPMAVFEVRTLYFIAQYSLSLNIAATCKKHNRL